MSGRIGDFIDHSRNAARFNQDEARTGWHDGALWFVREKRDRAAGDVPEWEELRDAAAQIKQHALSHLSDYLEQFEREALARGAVVHWAADADEHNTIVLELLQKCGASLVVKSKSMLTEECGLNPFLEQEGMTVIDTDLGERIQQLRGEPPSHIVMPAIHTKREEIAELFHEKLGTEQGNADPQYLTAAARVHLREKFLQADAALTGVNFGVAETGAIVVCTNEGNADMGVSLAPLHIASMGLEKIIPRSADLSVFLRLLARSATGQPLTVYTSHFLGPPAGGELHIVLVDNGRSRLLSRDKHWRSLCCIRCGACLNTCPVYRRSGGHSYGHNPPGPIGMVQAPSKDLRKYRQLPFASTLCGSCTDVCPTKVDLHDQLLSWRAEIVKAGLVPMGKTLTMKLAGLVVAHHGLYRLAGRLARLAHPLLPQAWLRRISPWHRRRESPPLPPKSFKDLYRERHERQS